ncbi:MAG TPA: helix-turn-helix domain-containing protein [Terriglobales bacterium]|nr:helix-turn-helix domain-containing protein [Terriglobales bacterium]
MTPETKAQRIVQAKAIELATRFLEQVVVPDIFFGGWALRPVRDRCKRKSKKPSPAPEATGDILTPEQLADRLQVDISWVYTQTGRRARVRNPDPLPYRKMGRYLRFSWREVEAWLERQGSRR